MLCPQSYSWTRSYRVWKLQQEIGFFREEWKKVEKNGRKRWKKYMKPNDYRNTVFGRKVPMQCEVLEYQCKYMSFTNSRILQGDSVVQYPYIVSHYFMYSRSSQKMLQCPHFDNETKLSYNAHIFSQILCFDNSFSSQAFFNCLEINYIV